MNHFVFDSALMQPLDSIYLQEVVKLLAISFILNDSLKVIIIDLMAVTESLELLDDIETALAESVDALQHKSIAIGTGHVLDECFYDIFHIVGCVVKLIKSLY